MSRREQYREQIREEIKDNARRQMAEGSAAGISLNAIAKEMDVAVSGLYRYFENRDALLTALIVDAFNAQADAMQQAESAQPRHDYGARLLAAMSGYRSWAVEHPAEFGLIYGTPVPGYHAPRDVTVPAASRAMSVVLGVLNEAAQAGALSALSPDLLSVEVIDMGVPREIGLWGVVGWSRIHGIVALEVFGHLDGVIGNVETFFRHECLHLIRESGIPPPPD